MQRMASIAFGLSVAMLGCGNDGGSADGDADVTDADVTDDVTDDAPPPPDGMEPPARGFQVQSPEIVIEPGQEITYCYYFRTPNTETMAVKRFVSSMTPGSHHMIMFKTQNDVQPAGTVSSSGCGINISGTDAPQWIYAAQTPESDLAFPTDDGTGKPLAIDIGPNSAAYFQMHYLNASDNPMTVRVTLNAEALEPTVEYTKTAAFVSYNGAIDIPANAPSHMERETCPVASDAKFWLMSTHAHKRAISTAVRNGSEVTFQSNDWEHPGQKTWMTPAEFYSFNSSLTYECSYNNTGGPRVQDGDSAQTDEMCMASGYYFRTAANKQAIPRFCYTIADGQSFPYPSWSN